MAGGGNGEVKLLGTWSSPFVLRVRLALSLKGVSYEYVEENLKSKSELLLKSNPVYTKVPVLIHNGKPVCESLVIMQYIDEAFAGIDPSLFPEDPHDRAIARFFWASYIDGMFLKASSQESSGNWQDGGGKGRGKEKQAAATVETLEGALKECSKGKPFFGGDSAGYVDVVLGGLLAWVHAGDAMKGVKTFDPATTPLLVAWADSFDALDAVEAVMHAGRHVS